MELLALILFNLMFGVGLYYFVSLKIHREIHEYHASRLNQEFNKTLQKFTVEADNQIEYLDRKVETMLNLIEKSKQTANNLTQERKEASLLESELKTLREDLEPELEFLREKLKQIPQVFTQEIKEPTEQRHPYDEFSEALPEEVPAKKPQGISMGETGVFPAALNYRSSNPYGESKRILQPDTNPPYEPPSRKKEEKPGFAEELVGGIGKGLKSVLGIDDSPVATEVASTKRQTLPTTPKPRLDVSIGGDPFQEETTLIKNNTAPDSPFFQQLDQRWDQEGTKRKYSLDSSQISPALVLKEIDPDSNTIDKTVHLLKKGFSKSEIADFLEIQTAQVTLIEKIHLDRSRRK